MSDSNAESAGKIKLPVFVNSHWLPSHVTAILRHAGVVATQFTGPPGSIAETPGLRGSFGNLFRGPGRAGADQAGTLSNPVRGPAV